VQRGATVVDLPNFLRRNSIHFYRRRNKKPPISPTRRPQPNHSHQNAATTTPTAPPPRPPPQGRCHRRSRERRKRHDRLADNRFSDNCLSDNRFTNDCFSDDRHSNDRPTNDHRLADYRFSDKDRPTIDRQPSTIVRWMRILSMLGSVGVTGRMMTLMRAALAWGHQIMSPPLMRARTNALPPPQRRYPFLPTKSLCVLPVVVQHSRPRRSQFLDAPLPKLQRQNPLRIVVWRELGGVRQVG
jgi:hypothetical protein